MTTLVRGQDLISAWKAGAQVLLTDDHHRVSNLITDIENPSLFDPSWLKRFDPKCVGAKDRLSVVAKVLFPLNAKPANMPRAQFYSWWNKVLNRNRSLGHLEARWGTYFGRLTMFNGTENQIERIIHALSDWGNRAEAALVAHISAPTLDSIQPIGSPCLQYIEVLWRKDEQIDLVAVYRNHDFLNKALGNFLGLARLLTFIAAESGKTAGSLTCHSVHAYCDRATKLAQLISR